MDRKIVMGYSQIGAESEWRTACTNSIQAAAKEWNIELIFSDAQQKQENQLQAIRTFIQQKVDVIGFTPVVTTGWQAILQECKDAGIPVICVDRDAADATDLYNCFIGSDFITEGHMAIDWIVKYMKATGNTRGKDDGSKTINVALLEGTVGADAAVGRTKGFKEKLPANYKIVLQQSGNFTRAEGLQVIEAWTKSPQWATLDVLYAENDDMVNGAYDVIKASGKVPTKDLIIVGTDAVKGAFDAMLAGNMNATVECNPLLGPQVMETAVKILKGESVPKTVYSVDHTFDQTNAKEAYPSRQY
jgi:simple sugar transport system substrate-binding protein